MIRLNEEIVRQEQQVKYLGIILDNKDTESVLKKAYYRTQRVCRILAEKGSIETCFKYGLRMDQKRAKELGRKFLGQKPNTYEPMGKLLSINTQKFVSLKVGNQRKRCTDGQMVKPYKENLCYPAMRPS